jgi:[protein-PII] uridylyltransferase
VGVFTLNDIKVLSANIFTLKNGLAFDTYEVTNPLDPYREEERWDKVREDLLSTIEDRLDLDERIRSKGEMALDRQAYEIAQAPQVKIDNEISDFFTVIEVNTGDRVGILYDLAKELSGLQLDIRFARVNSDGERMNGVFYVRTAEGQKVQEEKDLERIREGLRSVMGGGHP